MTLIFFVPPSPFSGTSLSACLKALVVLEISQCAFAASILRRSPPKAHNTIVQLFEWPWNSVASECTSFLGPAGFGYVQVSPPNEHITGTQWWTDYQPVSYTLTSKRGSRAQFSAMVSACNKAGVGVIADVVLNHMTAGSGVGFAGNVYSKYNYPAVPYNASQFHYCDGNAAAPVTDYTNAYNVRFCELSGLADLAQEQTSVRNIMAAYLNDLLSLGVAGFRIDAAKHMSPTDIGAIRALLKFSYYDTQEVIYGANEAVQPSQYVNTGDVIEFRAPSSMLTYFTGSPGIAALVTPSPMGAAWGFVDSSIANYIMANQDTERGGTSLNSQSANNAYLLSAIFMLGFNYGTPTVYSGYDFSSYDQGAPQSPAGYTSPVTCSSNGWRCEHRWPGIANMVAYHNAAGSAALTNVFVGTSQQVAFGRGAVGFLIINNDAFTWTNTWTTSLPVGTYCDIIHDNTPNPTTCNGPSYVVSASGKLSASVAQYDALAIFIGAATLGSVANTTISSSIVPTNASTFGSVVPANTTSSIFSRASSSQAGSSFKASSSSSFPTGVLSTATASTTSSPISASSAATITFVETSSTASDEVLKIVGSISQLGNWAPSAALPLAPPSSGNLLWTLTVTLPPGTYFEYKFIKVTSSGSVTWEANDNRVYTTPSAGTSVTLYGTFGSSGSSTSVATAGTTTTSTASSPASTQATVMFQEFASTASGEVIKLVGSLSQLGSWAPASAVTLTNTNSVWSATLALPPNTAFQYKFIRVKSGSVSWESVPNRSYTTLGQGSSVTLTSSFR
ncbi:Alpha-amylase [Mycena sanguinolenta]|uniref:Alpha-amylase n=1 Tax=Mycena sanguinolenta TaxID=230812 RepID=A0A8H6YGA5_9AGAR|nr:Alpha-amylase [Mycena sanguinolenta]